MKLRKANSPAAGRKKLFLFILPLSVLAVVALGSACKLQFPSQSPMAFAGPPVRNAPSGTACKPAVCPEPAVRVAANVPDAGLPKTRSTAESKSATQTGTSQSANPPAKTSPPARKTPPPPSPGGPRLSALIARDQLEKMAGARVVFDAPERMRAGIKEKIQARVPDELADDFTKTLKESGITDADEIMAGSSIRARLSGDGFDITPLNDEERMLQGEGPVPWIWDVTPLRSGPQSLLLTVTVSTKVPGSDSEERRELPVFTKTVTVDSSPVYSAVRFVKGWVWLAPVFIAILLLVWLLRKWRARRRRS
jgi:hypothetical protein